MKARGFTLIEWMIVTTIIGILAAIIIPNFIGNPVLNAKVGDCVAKGHGLESWQLKQESWVIMEKGKSAWRLQRKGGTREDTLPFNETLTWSIVSCAL